MNRVGIGYDVHRLVENRKLILGGVEIPYHVGLDGHSDADVLIHALSDALLGAIGAQDIGHYFPNSDLKWKGVSSLVFLHEIRGLLQQAGATINNIDSTVIAEAPKIIPHIPAMKKALAEALMLKTSQVGIKATTNETMGFVGRKEGIAAFAVASVEIK